MWNALPCPKMTAFWYKWIFQAVVPASLLWNLWLGKSTAGRSSGFWRLWSQQFHKCFISVLFWLQKRQVRSGSDFTGLNFLSDLVVNQGHGRKRTREREREVGGKRELGTLSWRGRGLRGTTCVCVCVCVCVCAELSIWLFSCRNWQLCLSFRTSVCTNAALCKMDFWVLTIMFFFSKGSSVGFHLQSTEGNI